jgi:hypothetical protein
MQNYKRIDGKSFKPQRANVKLQEYTKEQTTDLAHELGELNEAKIGQWEAADSRNIWLKGLGHGWGNPDLNQYQD